MTIKEAIDTIFSHNESIGIWEGSKDEKREYVLRWKGMAHKIPQEYLVKENWRIFGVVPESLFESDRLNIRVISEA